MYFNSAVRVRVKHEEELPPGRMVIWEPGDAHHYGNPVSRWTHSWLHCDGESVRRWVREFNLPVRTPFPLQDPECLDMRLDILYRECVARLRIDPRVAENLAHNVFLAVGEAATDEALLPERFLAVKRHLESRYDMPVRLEDLARRAHLSVPHFSSEWRRHFGCAPIEYLIRLRLRVASYLLHDCNMRINEVAGRVGYEDTFYFSRLFKKHFGVSPREWRRIHVQDAP